MWQPFFNFFIMADTDILFPSTLGKLENFLSVQFSKFSDGSLFPITHPRFCFNINVWLHLKHFCVVTFLHSENWRHKFSVDSVFWTFPLVQFSPSPILGSFSRLRHGYAKTFLRGDHSVLRKLETQIYHRFSFLNFSIDSVFPVTHLRFHFNIYAWLCIKHSCMDIYAWWPFCTSKKCQKKFAKIGSHIYA